jgi:hypothetical protein
MNRMCKWRQAFVLILFLPMSSLAAESPPAFVSFNGGAGVMPMSDWDREAKAYPNSYYLQNDYAGYMDLRLSLISGSRHSLRFAIGHIKTSSTVTYARRVAYDFNVQVTAVKTILWQFSAIPMEFSYEYHPAGNEGSVVPFIGAGISGYLTKVNQRNYDLYNYFGDPYLPIKRSGYDEIGYGFQAFVGVRAFVIPELFLETQLRARYADGTGVTDDHSDIKVMLNGFDFTVGVGSKF